MADHILKRFDEDLEKLNATINEMGGLTESQFAKALDAVLAKLKSLGRVYEKDNAVWLGSSRDSEDDKDRVLVRSDGTPGGYAWGAKKKLEILRREGAFPSK